MPDTPITAAVLAGGESRRMGKDKANLEVDGISLLESVVAAATDAGLSTMIIGRAGHDLPYGILHKFAHAEAIPDDEAGQGPVVGLVTALRRSDPAGAVLLLPCDVPGLRSEHINWIVEQAAPFLSSKPSVQAIVSARVRDGAPQPEPLFAIYRYAVLPAAEQLLEQGNASLTGLLEKIEYETINLSPEHEHAVADVDTPEDLERYSNRQA